MSLLGEDFEETLTFGFHLGEDSISLTLCIHTFLFCFCLSLDDLSLLLDLLWHDDIGTLCRALSFGTSQLSCTLSCISLFKCLCLGYLFCSHCLTLSLSLFLTTFGIGIGDFYLCLILTSHGCGIGSTGADTGLLLEVGLACLASHLFLSHTDLCFVDGLGSCFLSEGFDIARFVLDIGDIDIDELQADLLEFDLDILLDVLLEGIAVLIELLDRH